MSSGRDHVLGSIKSALGPHDRASVDARLGTRPRSILPQRAQGSAQELIERFSSEAAKVTADIISVRTAQDVPTAIAELAKAQNIPGDWRIAPALRHLPWDLGAGHNVMFGPADLSVNLGVSRGFAGIAETGTVVLASGPDDPMLLAFVAEFHVIVLSRADIVGGMEDAFEKITINGIPPRAVSMVTGPSRTGDIEMTLQFGAHGPKKLAIILHD